MKKVMMVAVTALLAFFVVVMAVEGIRSGRWSGDRMAIFFGVLLPILVLQFYSFARMKPVKDESELDDDDGGIDWREENVGGEVVNVWDGWIVLLNDAPVHEAKAVANQLESAHIRCRLKLLKEDRALHVYGDGVYGNYGMGTRMCVLVEPDNYLAAKHVFKKTDGL